MYSSASVPDRNYSYYRQEPNASHPLILAEQCQIETVSRLTYLCPARYAEGLRSKQDSVLPYRPVGKTEKIRLLLH